MNKGVICVIMILTVAPILVSTTLVCLEPSRWGGSIDPITIVSMAILGLLSTPLWPTYIPALIIAPLLMRKVAHNHSFRTIRLSILIGISLIVGGIAGGLVLVPVIIMSLNELRLAVSWAIAGVVSGAVTFCLIVIMYHRQINHFPLPSRCALL